MLAVGKCGFSWSYSLQTAPSTTPGVAVTPGSGSKGSYVQLASGANLTQDCYGLLLWFVAGNTSITIRDILADIGLDPAGGTSYSQTGGINNIFVPQAGNAVQGGRWFYFPLFIKAGASVGVRGQANNTSTFRCMARFFGLPTKPENMAVGTYSETIGVSGNGGTPYTTAIRRHGDHGPRLERPPGPAGIGNLLSATTSGRPRRRCILPSLAWVTGLLVAP
jgi:hypothetical protein